MTRGHPGAQRCDQCESQHRACDRVRPDCGNCRRKEKNCTWVRAGTHSPSPAIAASSAPSFSNTLPITSTAGPSSSNTSTSALSGQQAPSPSDEDENTDGNDISSNRSSQARSSLSLTHATYNISSAANIATMNRAARNSPSSAPDDNANKAASTRRAMISNPGQLAPGAQRQRHPRLPPGAENPQHHVERIRQFREQEARAETQNDEDARNQVPAVSSAGQPSHRFAYRSYREFQARRYAGVVQEEQETAVSGNPNLTPAPEQDAEELVSVASQALSQLRLQAAGQGMKLGDRYSKADESEEGGDGAAGTFLEEMRKLGPADNALTQMLMNELEEDFEKKRKKKRAGKGNKAAQKE